MLEEMDYLVIDVADNAKQAMHLARVTKPDIILMDINIKGTKDGISTAEEIYAVDPVPIIFLSSLTDKETFERAKRSQPYAYLTKPANKISLQRSIELAISKFNESNNLSPVLDSTWETTPFLKKNLLVKQDNKLVKLKFEEILAVEVEEKYCSIYVGEQKYVVRISLKDILEKLPPNHFIRTHRNFVVNTEMIDGIDLEENIIHTPYKEFPLGRKYRTELLNSDGFIS